ncbi:hypothetical protein DY000_02018151 [Brassica cretica]|uniref:Uncharacterized protein n=1 Tax=Brassica cretica TaxID=69181 RepID=A0ABQ7D3B8_BRACR|nr:hypothetical protein DY000_02018151 [Brassica cretica]
MMTKLNLFSVKSQSIKSKQEDQAAKQGHPTSPMSEPSRLAHDHHPKPTRPAPLRTPSKQKRSNIWTDNESFPKTQTEPYERV